MGVRAADDVRRRRAGRGRLQGARPVPARTRAPRSSTSTGRPTRSCRSTARSPTARATSRATRRGGPRGTGASAPRSSTPQRLVTHFTYRVRRRHARRALRADRHPARVAGEPVRPARAARRARTRRGSVRSRAVLRLTGPPSGRRASRFVLRTGPRGSFSTGWRRPGFVLRLPGIGGVVVRVPDTPSRPASATCDVSELGTCVQLTSVRRARRRERSRPARGRRAPRPLPRPRRPARPVRCDVRRHRGHPLRGRPPRAHARARAARSSSSRGRASASSSRSRARMTSGSSRTADPRPERGARQPAPLESSRSGQNRTSCRPVTAGPGARERDPREAAASCRMDVGLAARSDHGRWWMSPANTRPWRRRCRGGSARRATRRASRAARGARRPSAGSGPRSARAAAPVDGARCGSGPTGGRARSPSAQKYGRR